ncbi:MAG TPA: M20/M25/M40 family metallo-hydrolase [Gemmatimonadales bacterium]|nr:M20/M25/M40 family metallo-hydrolase [Gemmatimonadales bacterium]
MPAALALFSLLLATALRAQQAGDPAEARAIFAELIGINSTEEHGSTTPAARAVAARFLAAGFPAADVAVVGPDSTHLNVVARFRGTGRQKPILLLAHLDVVEALPSDWSLDPFRLTEKDGYFYGRGTSDIKDMAAIWVATILRLKREGFVPDRDIIVALTAGEESGVANGVQWLLANRRDLIDAVYCVNGDAGDPLARDGKVYARTVQASEKVYMDLELTVHNPGGHSSLPVPDNAIYRLAAALGRLSAFAFPIRLNEITRAYFERTAPEETPAVAKDMRLAGANADPAALRRLAQVSPLYNALVRTTCVATRLEGGHANNALPQTAQAIVNCRMLPDDVGDSVVAAIRRVVADTAVTVSVITAPVPSPPSPLAPEVLGPVERITHEMWPGAIVVPNMETGASDGLYLRNAGMPVYGISAVPLDADDIRAHGRDERIRVAAFDQGVEYGYRLVRALGGGAP